MSKKCIHRAAGIFPTAQGPFIFDEDKMYSLLGSGLDDLTEANGPGYSGVPPLDQKYFKIPLACP
ncbi:MAG: hypothetical protein CMO74_07400 [Verrucomicrobiales bacterium]|nr:hypothetical protein [Verrucomicrobiales bacterium]